MGYFIRRDDVDCKDVIRSLVSTLKVHTTDLAPPCHGPFPRKPELTFRLVAVAEGVRKGDIQCVYSYCSDSKFQNVLPCGVTWSS
jgi:hypothetical protein